MQGAAEAVQGAAPALNGIKPVYKGCYTDERGNRALPNNLKISQELTNPVCWQHCAGFKFAGTQVSDVYQLHLYFCRTMGKESLRKERGENTSLECHIDLKSLNSLIR